MKKIIVICAVFGLFGTATPMKQLRHPCLPLEFYKHAFGWLVKKTETNSNFKRELLELIETRMAIVESLKTNKEYTMEASLSTMHSAFPLCEKLRKVGMAHEANLINHYAVYSSNMLRFAIRKNLGIEPPRDTVFENRLFAYETWPMKEVSENESDQCFRKNYSQHKVLVPAMLAEEKMAHTVMKHFIQNPEVIHQKHIDDYLNYGKKMNHLAHDKI